MTEDIATCRLRSIDPRECAANFQWISRHQVVSTTERNRSSLARRRNRQEQICACRVWSSLLCFRRSWPTGHESSNSTADSTCVCLFVLLLSKLVFYVHKSRFLSFYIYIYILYSGKLVFFSSKLDACSACVEPRMLICCRGCCSEQTLDGSLACPCFAFVWEIAWQCI